jgi:phosphoenolpyruvate synthase/pyruvate phosphate dikinase
VNVSRIGLKRREGPEWVCRHCEVYRIFLRETRLDQRIKDIFIGLDTRNLDNLGQRGRQIRQAIVAANLPQDINGQLLRPTID